MEISCYKLYPKIISCYSYIQTLYHVISDIYIYIYIMLHHVIVIFKHYIMLYFFISSQYYIMTSHDIPTFTIYSPNIFAAGPAPRWPPPTDQNEDRQDQRHTGAAIQKSHDLPRHEGQLRQLRKARS